MSVKPAAAQASILTNDLIRDPSVSGADVQISANWMMTQGPGRFAKASSSPMVQQFFEKDVNGNYVYNIAPRATAYTKSEIDGLLPSGTFQFDFQQYSYNDGLDNYHERSYIWNSTGFSLANNVTFYVNPVTGERSISNLQVQSVHTVSPSLYPEDNFDFASNDPLAIAANLAGYGQSYIDPSLIGRKVSFEFTGSWPVKSTYTYSDFIADKTALQGFATGITDIASLWPGVTSFLSDLKTNGPGYFYDTLGRPVFFGTNADDILGDYSVKNAGYFGGASPDTTGISLIGGAGADDISGGVANDLLFGGIGNDEFFADARLFGLGPASSSGSGNDIIHGGGVGLAWNLDGTDFATYSQAGSGLQIGVSQDSASLYGGAAIEIVGGSTIGRDLLYSIEGLELTPFQDIFRTNDVVTFSQIQGVKIDGGAGQDTIDFSGATSGATINIKPGPVSGPVTIDGVRFENFETIIGSASNDIFRLPGLNPGGALTALQQQ